MSFLRVTDLDTGEIVYDSRDETVKFYLTEWVHSVLATRAQSGIPESPSAPGFYTKDEMERIERQQDEAFDFRYNWDQVADGYVGEVESNDESEEES